MMVTKFLVSDNIGKGFQVLNWPTKFLFALVFIHLLHWRLTDYQPMLECVKNLIERFIIPYGALKGEDHLSEVIDKVLQLLLCTLDGLKSSNDMATISQCLVQWAPAFNLRNSRYCLSWSSSIFCVIHLVPAFLFYWLMFGFWLSAFWPF